MSDEFNGTIIIKATDETLDLYINNSLSKSQVMNIMYEVLSALDSLDIDDDEKIPQGAFSSLLQ